MQWRRDCGGWRPPSAPPRPTCYLLRDESAVPCCNRPCDRAVRLIRADRILVHRSDAGRGERLCCPGVVDEAGVTIEEGMPDVAAGRRRQGGFAIGDALVVTRADPE